MKGIVNNLNNLCAIENSFVGRKYLKLIMTGHTTIPFYNRKFYPYKWIKAATHFSLSGTSLD